MSRLLFILGNTKLIETDKCIVTRMIRQDGKKDSDIYHFKGWAQSKLHSRSLKSYMFNSTSQYTVAYFRRNAPFANFERQMITIQSEGLLHPQRDCVKKRIWPFWLTTSCLGNLAYSLTLPETFVGPICSAWYISIQTVSYKTIWCIR